MASAASSFSAILVGGVLCVWVAGCQHDSDERLGLDENRTPARFDVSSLERSGELEKALSQPVSEVQKKLGSYRLVESAHLSLGAVVRSGGTPMMPDGHERKDTLDESWRLEVDALGSAHALHENSHGYGIESVSVDHSFFVRPKNSRYVRRAPEGDEVERARDEVEGVLGSYLSVLGRFASRHDEGAVTVEGRPARKITLALGQPKLPFRDADPSHAWRASMRVSALTGEIVVDAASGAPLHAVLEASYVSPRSRTLSELSDDDGAALWTSVNEDVSVTVSLHVDAEAIGAVPTLRAPDDALAAPSRPRPMLDRQTLLEGLVAGPVAGEK